MSKFLLYLSYIGALYGLFKVIYDIKKRHRKWIDIRTRHEFVILILSIFVVTCFFVPWSKFHYGDEDKKIVYVDSSKLAKRHIDTSSKIQRDTLPTEPVKIKKKRLFKTKPDIAKEDLSVKVDRSPGSIIQGGKNNTIYINAEKQLTEAGLKMVRKSVDSLRSIYKIPKVVSIGSYPNCNAPLMLGQLENYFNDLGYHVDGGGSGMSNVVRYGFNYGFMDDSTRVTVYLGYFK